MFNQQKKNDDDDGTNGVIFTLYQQIVNYR
jgi:hypothetical protein